MKQLVKKALGRIFRKLQQVAAETPSQSLPVPQSCWDLYRDYISIDPTAIMAPSANIKIFNLPSEKRIMFSVGPGSHIFSTFALLRSDSSIHVGANSQLGSSTFICADKITVGDDVLMAWDATIMDNDSHSQIWANRQNDVRNCYRDYLRDPQNFIESKDWTNVSMSPIRIGNRAWIGFGVAILKGVNVGDEAVLGACSVVTRNVDSRTTVAGNPARKVSKN